ncbi:hypothetical protein J3F83DRAFT_594552 [Trichoderma novae-zelandiae]
MSNTPAINGAQKPATLLAKDLISRATIKYLGFNDEAAAYIWADVPEGLLRHMSTDADDWWTRSFIDLVIEYLYLSGQKLNTCDDDDWRWRQCMDRCGINRETRAAIMDPAFREIRRTQSCLYWLRDTMELRFQALLDIRCADIASPPDPDQTVQRASDDSASRPSQSDETAMSEAALHAAHNPSESSVTLYKGIDRASVSRLFEDTGDLSRISALASVPPTDVCGSASAYYFYVDRDVAEQQACYVRRRSSLTPVVLVRATIRKSTLESVYKGPRRQEVYWPDEDWKRLVFSCRRDNACPPDLARYMDASLVIATAATRANLFYNKLVKGPDKITEDMVLKNRHGEDAVQYCFRRYDGDHLLAKHAELEMLPFTEQEFQSWRIEARHEEMRDIPWFFMRFSAPSGECLA